MYGHNVSSYPWKYARKTNSYYDWIDWFAKLNSFNRRKAMQLIVKLEMRSTEMLCKQMWGYIMLNIVSLHIS